MCSEATWSSNRLQWGLCDGNGGAMSVSLHDPDPDGLAGRHSGRFRLEVHHRMSTQRCGVGIEVTAGPSPVFHHHESLF